jgi:hypothetical protein
MEIDKAKQHKVNHIDPLEQMHFNRLDCTSTEVQFEEHINSQAVDCTL